MKQLPRPRLTSAHALLIVALCSHLFVAGSFAETRPPETVSEQADRATRLDVSPRHEGLVASRPNLTLARGDSSGRSSAFAAAALNRTVAELTAAEKPARAADLPRPVFSAARLPAASRAPPPPAI